MKKFLFIISLIILILVIGGLIYFLLFKKPAEKPSLVPEEKTMEEILEDLTAPGEGEVSEDILKSLTAPE